MIIQGSSDITSSYAASLQSGITRLSSQVGTTSPSTMTDTVSISDAARNALTALSASSSPNSTAATPPPQVKPIDQMTAEEIDAIQKKLGFVNTMANLSPAEKALYDKAVASGNTGAVAGLNQIALIRMRNVAGGASGSTYDPQNNAITATNIQQYFSQSIIDPSSASTSNFQALIQFLQNNPSA